jgi:hypothetical protein
MQLSYNNKNALQAGLIIAGEAGRWMHTAAAFAAGPFDACTRVPARAREQQRAHWPCKRTTAAASFLFLERSHK